MARLKIDYGIDLGTTNSAIARMENGESVIKQTKNLMDTLPSCVYFFKNKKGEHSIRVGVKAKNAIYSDAIMALSKDMPQPDYGYLEFKREMGSDKKYSNANMAKSFYTPEELSAEVLKELKSVINDETVESVVITVPAMFTANQKDATMRAARLAGFKQCELLQEPIAACMAYGLSSKQKDGHWLVFDFGGGTFDAALVRVEDGILNVYDTEGDNFLGGKNLDEEVVNKILLPKLEEDYDLTSYKQIAWKRKALQDALKEFAEEMRIELSFADSTSTYDKDLCLEQKDDNGNDIEINITITRQELAEVISPLYQKAVDICKSLLNRNNLSGSDITSLILVGGPTCSPIIRDMLREQVSRNVDISINPMTAVARGAALYASTIDANIDEESIKQTAKSEVVFLEIGYQSTSVGQSEWVSINIDKEKTGNNCPQELIVELSRNDGAWKSDRININMQGNLIEAFLLEGKPNTFKIHTYDFYGNAVETFPTEFTIIQGINIGAAPLPYNIGIAVYDNTKKRGVFEPAKGLEKNKPLPAVGTISEKRTTRTLRPGISSDILMIPIYQASGLEAKGKTAALNKLFGEIVVTGDDIDTLIPENSTVEVTIRVDTSEHMKIDVYFPSVDFTVTKDLKILDDSHEEAIKWINRELVEAQQSINKLANFGVKVDDLQKELNEIEANDKIVNESLKTQSNLKELLREIETLEDNTEWQRLEKEIREEFERLEKAQNELGDNKTAQIVEQLRVQTDNVIREKNVKMGREILEQISSLFVHLTLVYQCMGLIQDCHRRFGGIRWKDSSRARQLINKGLEEINGQPTVEKLHPIACSLIELMPDSEAANANGLLRR